MAPIHLNFIDPNDTDKEKRIVELLQDLINGNTSPKSCAEKIDDIIVTDSASSSALDWQKYLWDCIGKAAILVQTDHPGQDHLVAFLQELQQLPRHNVQYHVGEEVFTKELWHLKAQNRYDGFEQWMWELDQGKFVGGRQVEQSGEAAHSYQNFSAFSARLLSNGVIEATRLSALVPPSPFATKSPNRSTAGHYEPYAGAAAQWILHAGAALFEMCEKETLVEIGAYKWTPTVWKNWKQKFEAVGTTETLSRECRELAAKVVEHMSKIERDGITTEIVSTFGFMIVKEEDDEED
nr:hypothetical protein CFP56_39034 [Quercus suber]